MQETQKQLAAQDGGLRIREPDANGGEGAMDEAAGAKQNSIGNVDLASTQSSLKKG